VSTKPELIEREFATARRTLGRQLTEAEEKAREVIDWKTHYRRNPLPLLAAAAVTGFAISALIGSRNGDDHVQRTHTRQPVFAGTASLNSTAGMMMEALVAAASIKAASYIDQWIPGFHDQFRRRRD